MSIGTGIAIASLWIYAGLCAHSTTLNGVGYLIGVMISIVLTFVFLDEGEIFK
jgi:VIT1/CCC1 family predicted Fe2+/Mn2+ transporter